MSSAPDSETPEEHPPARHTSSDTDTEEAFRIMELDYKALVENTPLGIYTSTPEGRFISANPAMARMFGYDSPEELLSSVTDIAAQIFHNPEAREELLMLLALHNEVLDYECRMIRRDKSTFWISATVRALRDENGNVVMNQGFLSDITERKKTEETLSESEERYRRITECLTDYLYSVRVEDGRIAQTVHSPACEAVTGYTAEEFAADPYLWINMVLPEDRDMVREQARSVLAHGRADPLEHRIHRKDGSVRWISNTIVPKSDLQGHLVAYDGLIKDITERKNMDLALRKSETRVRNKLHALLSPGGDIGTLALEDILDIQAIQLLMDDFFSLTNIGSAIVDLQGKVLVSTGWQDICTMFHRVHPQTRYNCLESDTQLSVSGEPGTFKLYKCKNNLWDVATPIIIGGNHLGNLFLGQFLFAEDVPDRDLFRKQAHEYGFDETAYLAALDRVTRFSEQTVHHAMAFYARLADLVSSLSFGQIKLARARVEQARVEEELKLVNARLESSLAEKDKFFAIIAHDLRSPFIGFLSFIRLMSGHIEQMSQEDIRRLAADMKDNAENLYNLLNNLLDWARMQRGITPYEPRMHPLSGLIRGTLDLIAPTARQKSIVLNCAVPDHVTIYADQPMLSTVFRNLLFNAIKFTGREGVVTITAITEGKTLRITVQDTGVGMDAATLQGLFSLDRRTCTRGTEGERGSGLGLLLCKEFIEKHGGTIRAESTPGLGTTFTFTMPAHG
ncbi:PocR ligand-binding domain-containing protein [Desulfonatronum parangueonense]